MNAEDLDRLNKLDSLIAWNNPEDGGRPLTEEEREEHSRLAWQLLQEKEGIKDNGKEGF